jgi:alkaline phosphatase
VALGGGLADFLPETVELERAVEAVLDYQRRHPDVLVLLIADHATGGLAINDFVDLEALRRQPASVDWMTAQSKTSPCPVFPRLTRSAIVVSERRSRDGRAGRGVRASSGFASASRRRSSGS